MADDVSVVIGATLGGLISGLANAKSAIEGFAAATASAFAIHEIDDFIDKMAKMGTTIEKTAAQLGAPVEQVQEFGAMAIASGTSAEAFTNMMNRLAVGMERSQVATSQQAAAAKALGINFKEFTAASPESKIYILSDALHRLGDGATKTAAVLMLAGRGAAQNIGFLDQGSAVIKAWQKAMEDAGAVISKDMVEGLANLDRNLVLTSSTWTAFGETIVAKISPGVEALLRAFTNLGTAFISSTKEGGALNLLFEGINGWLKLLATAITAWQMAWSDTWSGIKNIVLAIGEAIKNLGTLMYDVFSFNWSKVSADWDNLKDQIHSRLVAIGADFVKNFTDAKAQVDKIWSTSPGIAPGGGGAAGPQAPPTNLGAAQAAKNALKDADLVYATLKIKEDEAVKTYQITEAERTEILKAALKTRMDAEIAAGENKKIAEDKYQKDLAELDAQTTEKIIADWKKVADQFASDFSSALDQVLTKQKSFGAAMGAMFGKMIEQMIADVVKLIAEYVILNAAIGAGLGGPTAKPVTVAGLAGSAFPLLGGILGGGGVAGGAQAAATTANTTAVTALTAAMTGHVAATATQTVATTTNTAATFEGAAVTTLHTAVITPNTIATTANTFATELNTIKGFFPGFAQGAWKIPSYQSGVASQPFTGLAVLHPGEMVIPAGPAEAIRTGAAGVGGAPSVSLSVSAIDGPSFANWLRSGGGNQISRYITQAWQNNPSNRPGYTQ